MWNPDPRLDYNGKYPAFELGMARQTLIASLRSSHSETLERLKPRIGIPSHYGPPVPLLPPISPPVAPPASPPTSRHTDSNTFFSSEDDVILKKRRLSKKGSVTTSTVVRTDPAESTDAEEPPIDPFAIVKDDSNESRDSNKSEDCDVIEMPQPSKEVIDLTDDDAQPSPTADQQEDAQDASDVATKFALGDDFKEIVTQEFVDIYKCDFCTFKTDDLDHTDIDTHLQNTKHYSASRYKAWKRENQSAAEIAYVDRKLEVKKMQNKYEALVVLCPECSDVFEDIFMCGQHHKLVHGSERGKFCVCPVVHRSTITVHNKPLCQMCRVRFNSHKDLHSHWKSQPQHHPVTRPVPENALSLFICPYCEMTFVENFYGCKTHIMNHKMQKISDQAISAMKIRYVQKSQRCEEVPLTKEEVQGTKSALTDSIETLKRMKNHFSTMGSSGLKRKMIQHEIKQMRSHVAS